MALHLQGWLETQLRSQLAKPISEEICTQFPLLYWVWEHAPGAWQVLCDTVDVKLVRGVRAVIYEWAIAPKVAALMVAQSPPPHPAALCYAEEFAQILQAAWEGCLDENWAACRITVRLPGLIQIEVTDRPLVAWVHQLHAVPPPAPVLQTPIAPVPPRDGFENPDWFLVQVAHARCCALLRLGMQTSQLQLVDPYAPWPQLCTVPPWPGAPEHLSLQEPDWALFQLCIRGLDAWGRSPKPPSAASLARAGQLLAQALLHYDAACGLPSSQTPKNLGLVLLCQRVLGLLLDAAGLVLPGSL